jgi:hypothetical protein
MNNRPTHSLARNSFEFISFPDPWKRYQNTPLITPFLSHRFALRALQLLSFDIVSENTGGRRLVPYTSSTSFTSSNSFRIRTCKSVSKQRTSTPFGMNTYKKIGGRGISLLSTVPVPRFRANAAPLLSGSVVTDNPSLDHHAPSLYNASFTGMHFAPPEKLDGPAHSRWAALFLDSTLRSPTA